MTLNIKRNWNTGSLRGSLYPAPRDRGPGGNGEQTTWTPILVMAPSAPREKGSMSESLWWLPTILLTSSLALPAPWASVLWFFAHLLFSSYPGCSLLFRMLRYGPAPGSLHLCSPCIQFPSSLLFPDHPSKVKAHLHHAPHTISPSLSHHSYIDDDLEGSYVFPATYLPPL